MLAGVSPATVATGIDLWLADAAELTAPWAGQVTAPAPGHVVLTGEGLVLTMQGLGAERAADSGVSSGSVSSGEALLRLPARTGCT